MSIRIENVHKKYKLTHALKGINLEIENGMFGLLGPNGAGKTTLMRLIMGLHQQSEGSIRVFGIDTSNRDEIRKIVSYLPQEYNFYPNMTVMESMDYMAILCGIKDKTIRRKRSVELLKSVNLIQEKKKKVKALSGGMKRRLGLAQSLIKDPKVLIVDEPTAGLDPEERLRIRNLLTEFSKERIVIFSTHIVEDISYSCNMLAIISEGEILYSGDKSTVIESAKNSVWQLSVEHDHLDKIKSKYKVTTITPQHNHVIVRCIGKDLELGERVPATLEDAYMYLMGTRDDKVSA